jgi:hypothetical protein
MSTTPRLQVSFSAELERGLGEAVKKLREKVDAVYGDCCEEEKMADLHYLAHDIVDREMDLLVAADPEVENTGLVDLREEVRRHIHRLIEKTRRA